jgi:hypothetical protein
MLKSSKAPVANRNRKASSTSYQAYYGITLIETLMSVGLLGVILIPLLMTSTAYLSTKLLKNRSATELSQNVNALGFKLNALAAATTGINYQTATATNLEMRTKTSTGDKRIFQYNIIGGTGSQRLREFQGTANNLSSSSAMRSLNEDSVTLVGTTGFVYCNATACTNSTNNLATNQEIARTAEIVVFDGNTATPVTRAGFGTVNDAEPVALVYNAGDSSRKRGFLPNNIFALGTDSVAGSNATVVPNPTVVNNTDPDGVLNVFTKAQVYGTPMGGGPVDADLRLATGSESGFTALPLALPGSEPPIPPALPVIPLTTQTTRTDFSRIYKEGPGTAATGNTRPILPNFRLDQTVADSFQGNMCFSGNRSLDNAFQVYYWNRTMSQAALTSVQSVSTVADPFTVTPECAGASSGYNNDANAGTYYINSYPRNQWQAPITTTKTAPDSYTKHNTDSRGWKEDLTNGGTETSWWRAWSYGDTGYNGYYYTSGTAGHNNTFLGIGGWDGFDLDYYTADGLGSKTVPVFGTPPTSIGVVSDHTLTAADEVGQDQAQKQTIMPNGLHVLIHKAGDDASLSASVNDIDPLGGNNQSNIYNRGLKEFEIIGTEGGNGNTCQGAGLNNPVVNAHHQWDWDICTPLYNDTANDTWWKSDPKNTNVTIADIPFSHSKVHVPITLEIRGLFKEEASSIPFTPSSTKFYVTSIVDPDNSTTHSWTYPLPTTVPWNSWSVSYGGYPYNPVYLFHQDYGVPVNYDSDTSAYYLQLGYGNCKLVADDGSIDSANENVYCINPYASGAPAWEINYIGVDTKKIFRSQRNTFIRSEWATVPVKKYVNPAPIAGADTINSTSFAAPYVIRDNSENYLFYNLIKGSGINQTNQLYSFNPTTEKTVAGPLVNLDWGDVATARLAQGKRVLSYSPHNKVAVTGNTSTYGNVYAWYYDRVDQPVAKLKTGGVGFNSAQANSTNVNYIADPTSTFNAYQTNLTAVTSEGSTLYTLNSVTGTLTRYVTRIGQYNHVRQSETRLTSGIVNASSAIAVSPMDDGLYLLDAGNRTVRYYADRRSISITPPQAVARSFSTSQATLPTGLAVSKATGLVYVLDSTLGTVTVGTTVTRTLNIHVYTPNGTFIETLALNVSDDQFVNAADRLVPQSGQIMRLTLDEKQSQFYVHVENNGRIYQFGVDRQI